MSQTPETNCFHDVARGTVSNCLKHLTYKVDTLINEVERAKIN